MAPRPLWQQVLKCFKHGGKPLTTIRRVKERYDPDGKPITKKGARWKVSIESWSHEQLGEIFERQFGSPKLRAPRRNHGPLVVLRTERGDFLLDGRKRANLWRHKPGSYKVLVIE